MVKPKNTNDQSCVRCGEKHDSGMCPHYAHNRGHHANLVVDSMTQKPTGTVVTQKYKERNINQTDIIIPHIEPDTNQDVNIFAHTKNSVTLPTLKTF